MNIRIISGFLGAGKTTFINRLLEVTQEPTAVIENEFGDLSIDTALLQQPLLVKEIKSGCICCTLRGRFEDAILEMYEKHGVDHLVIEPSGVGKLSDVIGACQAATKVHGTPVTILPIVTLVECASYEDYSASFGPFFIDQIQHADTILLTKMDEYTGDIDALIVSIRQHNPEACIYALDFRTITPNVFVDILGRNAKQATAKAPIEGASRPFMSLAIDHVGTMTREELLKRIRALEKEDYGTVLRMKGIVDTEEGKVLVQYTPTQWTMTPYTGEHASQLVIIGCDLNPKIRNLFSERRGTWEKLKIINASQKPKAVSVKTRNKR